MPAVLLPNGRQQFFTTPGVPAVGYKLMTWAAGTSTPQATWSDALKVGLNTNPIILDARGEAVIFWDGAYKIQLQDSTGAPVSAPVDNVQSQPAAATSLIPTIDNAFAIGSATFSWANVFVGPNHASVLDTVSGNIGYYARIAAETAAAVTPVNFQYSAQPCLWVRREGCVLDGVTDDALAFNRCLNVAAALGAPNFSLIIDGPLFLNISNLAIATNVQLVFVGNGKIKPGAGITVTLGQTPQAGLWQIFDLSSGGLVKMPVGNSARSMEVWGEWWGANGDGVTLLTNDVPINAALVSIFNAGASAGGTVRLGAGIFNISAIVNILSYTSLRGLNDFTKIRAKTGWTGGTVMIGANNGTNPLFDSRLEFLTLDGNNIAGIQAVVQSQGWQNRCGIYNCELLNFSQTGFLYQHGFGGAAVLCIENSDFFPNDVNGAIGAYFTADSTVGWLKLNVNNCVFASANTTGPGTAGTGTNATFGLQLDGHIICNVQGLDVEVLQYGVVLGVQSVLCGAGIGGGGQTPVIAGNAIVRCLATWSAGSGNPGSINVSGVKLGGWTNTIVDSNRTYACAALEPFDGQLVWPPNLIRPQGTCVVTGGAAPALANTTSLGVASKLAGASIAHNAAGQQTLTLATTMDSASNIITSITSMDTNAPQICTNVTGATTIQIFSFSKLGAAADCALFKLDVFHTP